ncbi:MAG: hypothetical protein WAN74_00690 [Thermoplasmata archaeon]
MRASDLSLGLGDLEQDGRSLLVTDSTADDTFDFLRYVAPDLTTDPNYDYFPLLHRAHVKRNAIRTVLGKGTDLDIGAIGSAGFRAGEFRPRVRPATWSRTDEFFAVFDEAGPERSGMLLEIVGVMGSGKSNTLAWIGLRALERGYEVFADFSLSPKPEHFHEVYLHSDLMLELVQFARTEPARPGFVLIDEAGGKGGGSKTASTLEARWAMGFLTKTRKFRVNSVRARQVNKLPDDQRQVVTGLITKDPSDRALLDVEWLQGSMVGAPGLPLTIEYCGDQYKTWAQSTLVWDLDVEELEAYLARRRGLENELDVIERFAKAYRVGDTPDGDENAPEPPDARDLSLPSELATMPEGGWPVACTRLGCTEEWSYTGSRLPVPGARIRCPKLHSVRLTQAIVARAALDRRRSSRGAPDMDGRPMATVQTSADPAAAAANGDSTRE